MLQLICLTFIIFFCDVVSRWRSKENGEDYRCSKGKVEVALPSRHLLNYVAFLYTIEAFGLFEKEFIDGAGYKYREVKSVSCNGRFEVRNVRGGNEGRGGELDGFKHIAFFF